MGRRHLRQVHAVRREPIRILIVVALLVSLPACGLAGQGSAVRREAEASPRPATIPPEPSPRPLTLRREALGRAKERLRIDGRELQPALDRLRQDADKALAAPIVAVTDKKTLLPPSGDAHDYFSLSPYWWPDPSKPDGLPYIRRDGVTNPESKRDLDQPRVAQMGGNVSTLALAWYFTGDDRYARRAGQQLRAWFIDPATRMTPHLRFSQLVRGNPEERGSGIIDTRWFIEAVDASELLEGAPGWTDADEQALRRWMADYLTWLQTSPNGKHEQAARNNHGSWYAAQTATYALFTGDTALVRRIATDAKARIGWQITPDGQQPIELERTRSMHYSGFNVEALSRVAELGRHVNVDLWRYEAPNGASLRRAMDHLAKYLPEPATWPGQQIDSIDVADMLRVLRRAQMAYDAPIYEPVLAKLDRATVQADRSALLYPVR
jgi:hypothetical protein